MSHPVLAIEDLHIAFGGRHVVHGIDLAVKPGEMVALVGTSGRARAYSARGHWASRSRWARDRGHVRLDGRDLVGLSEPELLPLRGADMAMIFQDPGTALNPAFSVGRQITDVLRAHRQLTTGAAWREAEALLASVGIPEARRRLRLYPHESRRHAPACHDRHGGGLQPSAAHRG